MRKEQWKVAAVEEGCCQCIVAVHEVMTASEVRVVPGRAWTEVGRL